MAIDGLLLHNIQNKLQEICPCKIGKIQNISDEEILIHLHSAKTGNHKLVINVHSNTNRIYLADTIQQVQPSPSNFVMVLRKNFGQGTIESIQQVGFDRILVFDIAARNEFQDLIRVKLYAEIMGKYANLILVNDQGIIIDALKRIPVYENSKRLVHPGANYKAPDPGNKMDPYHISNLNMETSLVNQVYGFSPILSKEFLYRMHNGQSFETILSELMNSDTLYTYEKEFHCIELSHLNQECKTFEFMSGLQHLFDEKEQKVRVKEQCKDVFQCVDKELARNIKKLPKLEDTLEKSMDYKKYQEYGDLLFAYQYEIKRDKTITLPSFETGEDVTIPIDMRFDIKDNANKYYQKYHKSKRAQVILKEQIEQCKDEIEYYTQLQEQLVHCNIDDAQEIKEELIKQHVLRPKKEIRKKKTKLPNILHLEYEGAHIYVGKNNIQNNYITHQLSRKQDMWFHVKDYHGSHVLCKSDILDETLIRMCANLAAYYSKGKQSSSVPVDYCPINQLKKVPGSKIGFVTMKSYKTIYIDPDPIEIEQWIQAYRVR